VRETRKRVLISEEEYRELRATFALEAVSSLLRREEATD
jgi:hypothetical protein